DYDKVGNRKSMKINDANTQVYDYDKLYQLTFADYNDGNTTGYSYDKLGNRTLMSNGGQTTYESNRLNQYSKVNTTNYTYDVNGNLTNDGTCTYYYDCENRVTIANPAPANAYYKYDFSGRRVKWRFGGPPSIIKFTYDGDQIIADYNNLGGLQRKYIYGPGIDEPVCMIDTGAHWYFFDGLGSVVALARTNQPLEEKYTYDVFGKPTIRNTQDAVLSTSAYGNRFMFTAREFEQETGLYYYRARYYKPTLGRFISRDPIELNGGLNFYTYVNNNPIRFRDPKGLRPCSQCQSRYDSARARIAEEEARCGGSCGSSDLGPSVGLCLIACAKTGWYFPLCVAACGASTQLPWAACHYLCGRMANANEAAVRAVYNHCMATCCHDEP
ncbi:MAG: RHS repeat-associated core domain-containing protein, partial [Sedimentisphaerales bacterium]|nr:RHS repeat-associated core domain-containing protein [Sedimentisphaerales bacterium]